MNFTLLFNAINVGLLCFVVWAVWRISRRLQG